MYNINIQYILAKNIITIRYSASFEKLAESIKIGESNFSVYFT